MRAKKLLATAIHKLREQQCDVNSKIYSAAILNYMTFFPYRNYCKGEKSIVLCGAGPTLQNYIPIGNAIHIALNRAFLFEKVNFDFVFAQDYEGIKMVENELISYRPDQCVKFFGKSDGGPKEIPESLSIKCNAKRFATDSFYRSNGFDSKFVCDIDLRPLGGMPNVGLSVMQFATYLNPDKIYLVGFDIAGTHFSDKNQTDEEKTKEESFLNEYYQNSSERLVSKWIEVREEIEHYYPDIQIFSVNPVALRGVFKDIDQ